MSLSELKMKFAAQKVTNTQTHSLGRTPCSEEHDQICRYVKQPDILTKILSALGLHGNAVGVCRTEVPMLEIKPGYHSEYRRRHGFADLVFTAGENHTVLLEVKSGQVVVGEVLRQIRTYLGCYAEFEYAANVEYGSYLLPTCVALVAAQLEPEQVEHLRGEGVTPIVLGTKYLEWKAPKGALAFEI